MHGPISSALVGFGLLRGLWLAYTGRTTALRGGEGQILAFAHADGRRDDSAHIQQAIDRASVVKLPAGTFAVRRQISTDRDTLLSGVPGRSTLWMD